MDIILSNLLSSNKMTQNPVELDGFPKDTPG